MPLFWIIYRPVHIISGICWTFQYDADSDSVESDEQAEVLPAPTLGGFLERMWAYSTIKKELKNFELGLDDNGINTPVKQMFER